MEELSFDNLLIVVLVAFAAPLLLGAVPRLRVPSVVLEIVAGILIGPAVLGWVEIDAAVEVLALVGLAFLLFLAGLEIDLSALRGTIARRAGTGFAASLALALLAGLALSLGGLVDSGLLVAVILVSTSLGVVVPVLQEAGESRSRFGQLVIAAASVADFAAIVLLSLLFSGEATGTGTKLLLIGAFAATLALVAATLLGAEHSRRISALLLRLQDTTAEIRIRVAVALLVGLVALAAEIGLETILGAFAAGVILGGIDRDEMMTHAQFRAKLQAVGFGVFIPVFFVATGVRFDLAAVFADPMAAASVPIFLAALLLVRGVPALLYRGELDGRRLAAAALLQASSLPFIVAATEIGLELGMIEPGPAAAFVFAGLLSVVLFPALALGLLSPSEARGTRPAAALAPAD